MKRSGAKAFPETNENAGVSLTLVNCFTYLRATTAQIYARWLSPPSQKQPFSKSMVVFKRYVGYLKPAPDKLQESGRQLALYGDLPSVIPPEAWKAGRAGRKLWEQPHKVCPPFQEDQVGVEGEWAPPTVTALTTSVILSTLITPSLVFYALREPGRTSRRAGLAPLTTLVAPPQTRSTGGPPITLCISRLTSLLPLPGFLLPPLSDFNTVTWGRTRGCRDKYGGSGLFGLNMAVPVRQWPRLLAVERTNWRLPASPPIRWNARTPGRALRSGGDWEGFVAGAPGAKAAASVRSIGLKASARPRPAGPGRRGGGGCCAAAGQPPRGAGGRTCRRCLCRGDGPVCTPVQELILTSSSPVWPRCVATKPSGLLVPNHLSFAELLKPFSRLTWGALLALSFLQSRGPGEGKLGAAGKRRAVFTSWSGIVASGWGPAVSLVAAGGGVP